jgi:phytoene synthase
MQQAEIQQEIFKRGSKTYFNSSRFFPPEARRDVTVLYGFVRKADDFVDAVPQDGDGFERFADDYRRAREGAASGDAVIDAFVELERRRGFDAAWADAFLASMRMDTEKSRYESLDETLTYIYGSAEVIGLFMSRIMELPREAEYPARMLGRAMQYINFIRDIAEDLELGRRYLPLEEGELVELSQAEAQRHPRAFSAWIARQLERYQHWQREAERGYRFIPLRYLVPIKTAADMYAWTGDVIRRDPFVVFRRKVKPPAGRIVLRGLRNAATLPLRKRSRR